MIPTDNVKLYQLIMLKLKWCQLIICAPVVFQLLFRFHVTCLTSSGLIAEYIRRNHYKEEVSVLTQFYPVWTSHHTASTGAEVDLFVVWAKTVNLSIIFQYTHFPLCRFILHSQYVQKEVPPRLLCNVLWSPWIDKGKLNLKNYTNARVYCIQFGK